MVRFGRSGTVTRIRAPMPSRFDSVPRSRQVIHRCLLGTWLRKNRICGEFRFDSHRSIRPSPSQSTLAAARASSAKSTPLTPETFAKREPATFRYRQLRSRPLNDFPWRTSRMSCCDGSLKSWLSLTTPLDTGAPSCCDSTCRQKKLHKSLESSVVI